MPHYYDLLPADELEENGYPRFVDRLNVSEKKRAIKKILEIKNHIFASGVPQKRDGNLVFASWNLKEFGQAKKHPEFYPYLAEIMFAFDLVVIQEVRRSIRELQILSNMLGDSWTYVINDVTEGNAGNNERSAILFDKKRVEFSGFSGELVVANGSQIKRTPHITGFLTGWKHFSVINVHLDPGQSTTNAAERKDELKRIMETLEPKLDTGGLGFENIILTGDFNFYPRVDDASIAMLKNDYGFRQVEKLSNVDTTLALNRFTYDRMFIRRDEYFEIVKDSSGDENGGVVEFRTLFASNLSTYKAKAKSDYASRNPGRTLTDSAYPNYFWVHWLSRQMSDHYPIWLEINTDSAERYLQSKLSAL